MSVIDCTLRAFSSAARRDDVAALVMLWNRSLRAVHGFFPLTEARFQRRIVECSRFNPERLLLAHIAGELVGAIHWDMVTEPYYPSAAVIEAIWVAPEARRHGVGGALLDAVLTDITGANKNSKPIYAFGAWPHSPFYTTLIDGSERSGVFQHDGASLRLFTRAGFTREQESFVLALDLPEKLTPLTAHEITAQKSVTAHREPREDHGTWLDIVFRGWRITEHRILTDKGELCARAMSCRMTGVSDYTGRETYAIFGVNTPASFRRRGWGRLNLHGLLTHLGTRGAKRVELHVYAKNNAAVRLYKGLGFREIACTVRLRR